MFCRLRPCITGPGVWCSGLLRWMKYRNASLSVSSKNSLKVNYFYPLRFEAQADARTTEVALYLRQEVHPMATTPKDPSKDQDPKPEPIDPPDDAPPVELPGDPMDKPNV